MWENVDICQKIYLYKSGGNNLANPRVFISSTCYDLKYIRENLKYFISNMGYESILSEDGDIFYNPDLHTHDACINEICTCQLFVLIIGGRYGGKYLDSNKSITNREYEEAVKQKIPVFTLVEKNVLSEHLVYQKNKDIPNVVDIKYPSVDNIKIFEFIDEVRKSTNNNAFFPFSNSHDIESYLKKQWAGMLYNFLTNSIETRHVSSLFEEIQKATDKIEYYTKQVALKVGDVQTKLLINIYEMMISKKIVQNLGFWNIKTTPYMIIKKESLDEICDNNIYITEDEGSSITGGGPPYECSKDRYNVMVNEYNNLRENILDILEKNSCTPEEFLKYENNITY